MSYLFFMISEFFLFKSSWILDILASKLSVYADLLIYMFLNRKNQRNWWMDRYLEIRMMLMCRSP